jgi:hypothetical protein
MRTHIKQLVTDDAGSNPSSFSVRQWIAVALQSRHGFFLHKALTRLIAIRLSTFER